MEEGSLAPPAPAGKVSQTKKGNGLLILGIVVVSLASFAVLGLFAQSLLTYGDRPPQTLEQRDALVAVANAKNAPKNAAMQLTAADALIAAGDYERALIYADHALKIEPMSPTARLVKAQALRGTGELKKARALAEEVAKAAGEGASLYVSASLVKALIDEAEGNLPAAVENLKVALASDPTNADLLVRLAAMQESIGSQDDAAATYGEVLNYVPDSEAALTALRAMKSGPADYELAKAAWKAGDEDEARRLMEQAAQESPQVAWIQVALGEFRRMVGDGEAAKAAFESALALDPENEEAKAGLESLK